MRMRLVRDSKAVANSLLAQEDSAALVVDSRELRRHRPKDACKQSERFSGKKKAHPDKNILLVDSRIKKVVYLSPTESDKKHDEKIAAENEIVYPTGICWAKAVAFKAISLAV